MAEVAFDTITEVRRLRDAGFGQDQAEALARSIHAGVTGGVATKADLAMAGAGLRADMERLGGELRTEIASVRTEIADLRTELKGDHADLRTELKGDIAGLRTGIASVRGDLLWIKLTGGAVLAAVVLPWLAEAAGPVFGN